jgi:starch-binding outer membrane protein, SusD/RagB family
MGAGLLTLSTLTGGCEVTNPGPVQDEFLTAPAAQPGVINGARRAISINFRSLAQDLALIGREVFPGGQTGAWGNPVHIHAGHIQDGYGPGFNAFQEARFITETAIQRFGEVGASDTMMHQAHLWAGVSYRLLGENWCDAVLASEDPRVTDPPQYVQGDVSGYFERAVRNFTAAYQRASNDEQRHAALAGRASAHLWLGNWGEALADARQVPDNFRFTVALSSSEETLFNYIYEATSGTFRSHTVRFTWFEDYYTQTGDPRTPWVIDPNHSVAVGSLTGFGQVPYRPQRKYDSRDDDINLFSGWEMRLVEAEAILQGAGSGNWNDAMTLINHVRTRNISDNDGQPLAPWVANSAEEAWTYLKRERGIELWLEGRRMGDERRWAERNTPGTLDLPQWEDPSHPGHSTLFVENRRGLSVDPRGGGPLCFDIPTAERDRNPNIPASLGG